MKNPLAKRLFRELKTDWKKYFVLFLLMTFMIGLASGVNVGNDSMMAAIDESYEKYNIENGHFELKNEPTEALLSSMPEEITLYEQFYKDAVQQTEKQRSGKDEKEVSVRIFKIRTEVNKACVMKGHMPETTTEIAIDMNQPFL